MAGYKTVLVGTDGSDTSFRAVDRAAEVARDANANLIIACAYSPVPDKERAQYADQLGQEAYKVEGSHPADDLLTEAEGRAKKAGAKKIETKAVKGDPVDVLVKLVEDNKADLIVVGNRGLNSLAGRLLGSVPANISHRAACDVLIVHTTTGRRS